MANNLTIGGNTFRTQDEGGVHTEKTKDSGTTLAVAGQVAVTTSTTTIRVAARTERRSLVILNDGTTDIELSPTSGFTLGTGMPLSAGDSFETTYTKALYVASAAGSGSFRYWEDSNE